MKILHIYAGNLFGGIETLLLTLARERYLCPDLEQQFALCFEARLSQELTSTGAKVHQLGAVKIRYLWQAFRARSKLVEIIEREGIDAVICHACWPQVIFGNIANQLGKPSIFWCHDTPKGNSLLEKLAKFVLPNLVIANSKYTQQHLNLLYPNTANLLLYYPVTPIKIENPKLVRHQVRQELGTAADTTTIIQVSRLERWKGHTQTIAALAHLKDLPNWECWMVGGLQRESEQDYWNELHEQVNKLGLSRQIRFLGQRQDVSDLLVAADIFCQPNLGAEPFGIVFIEALYAGLPVVTVNIGGGGEIVTPECGCAAAPRNVEEIGAALRALVESSNRRQQFRKSATNRAVELCDPRQQITKLYKTIQEISI